MKKKFRGAPYPPKKADLGRLKAKMGRFSQKGLCYSFEILQGFLTHKNIKFVKFFSPISIKFKGPILINCLSIQIVDETLTLHEKKNGDRNFTPTMVHLRVYCTFFPEGLP